ncbi:Ribosomal protein S6 kinase alpha-1 [Porphyridium purpureum]|uniref:Ribosomal protein S6 kinase alpha-1 n=1 Tax=Porphyridium purpureum TaxID=35688 RepID=A0A5J4Z826_PORPP|nr:Ribosomal protein S6 kinase alpha-1 [Porphyridium purpureum]|eukprot:POR4995..scf295_1
MESATSASEKDTGGWLLDPTSSGEQVYSSVENASKLSTLSSETWLRVHTDSEHGESTSPSSPSAQDEAGSRHHHSDRRARPGPSWSAHGAHEADLQLRPPQSTLIDDAELTRVLLPHNGRKDARAELEAFQSSAMSNLDHVVWLLYGCTVLKKIALRQPQERIVWVDSSLSALLISSRKGERDLEEAHVLEETDTSKRCIRIPFAQLKSVSVSPSELRLDVGTAQTSLRFGFHESEHARKLAVALHTLLQGSSCAFVAHAALGEPKSLVPAWNDTFMGSDVQRFSRVNEYVLLASLDCIGHEHHCSSKLTLQFLAFNTDTFTFHKVRFGRNEHRDVLLHSPESLVLLRKIAHSVAIPYARILFCDETFSGFFLVLDFVVSERECVEMRLSRGAAMPERQARLMAYDILTLLAYLFSSNVALGELSLDRVCISLDSSVRIDPLGILCFDFIDRNALAGESDPKGMAAAKDAMFLAVDSVASRTHRQQEICRALFQPPERRGNPSRIAPQIDSHAGFVRDTWALGILLYSLLSGTLLSSGCTSAEQVATKVDAAASDVSGTLRSSMRSSNSSTPLSRHATDFVGTCLQSDPARRPTAEQLLEHPWFSTNESESDQSLSGKSLRQSLTGSFPLATMLSRKRSEMRTSKSMSRRRRLILTPDDMDGIIEDATFWSELLPVEELAFKQTD